jgi:hypothetical protein
MPIPTPMHTPVHAHACLACFVALRVCRGACTAATSVLAGGSAAAIHRVHDPDCERLHRALLYIEILVYILHLCLVPTGAVLCRATDMRRAREGEREQPTAAAPAEGHARAEGCRVGETLETAWRDRERRPAYATPLSQARSSHSTDLTSSRRVVESPVH